MRAKYCISLINKLWKSNLVVKTVAILVLTTATGYAALCPVGYGGSECEDIPDYTGSTEGFSGNALIATDCERMGYQYYGAKKSNEASDPKEDFWPSFARKNNQNNEDQYNCERCEIENKVILNINGYARWNCYRTCADEENAEYVADYNATLYANRPYRDKFVRSQAHCTAKYGTYEETDYPKRMYQAITDKVCGKCVPMEDVPDLDKCDGLALSNPPSGCYYPATKVYSLPDGTECANQKQWNKMPEEWKPTKQENGCYITHTEPTADGGECYKQEVMPTSCEEGYTWNDYNASYRTDYDNCQCVPEYCPSGMYLYGDLPTDGCREPHETEIKSGEEYCYTSILLTADNMDCGEGREWNEETCKCQDVDCTENGLLNDCDESCEGGKRVTCTEEIYKGKTCYVKTETDDDDCSRPCSDGGYVDECIESCAGGTEVTCDDVTFDGRLCYDKTETPKDECNDDTCETFGFYSENTCGGYKGCSGTTEYTCKPKSTSDTISAGLSCYERGQQDCASGCVGNQCSDQTCESFTGYYSTLSACQADEYCSGSTAGVCESGKTPPGTALTCYHLKDETCNGVCQGNQCSDITCEKYSLYSEDTCDGYKGCSGTTEYTCTTGSTPQTAGAGLTCYKRGQQNCTGGCVSNQCSNRTCEDFTGYYSTLNACEAHESCTGSTAMVCKPGQTPEGTLLSCYHLVDETCNGVCQGTQCSDETCQTYSLLTYSECNNQAGCVGSGSGSKEKSCEYSRTINGESCYDLVETTCTHGCSSGSCRQCPSGASTSMPTQGCYTTVTAQDGYSTCYQSTTCCTGTYSSYTYITASAWNNLSNKDWYNKVDANGEQGGYCYKAKTCSERGGTTTAPQCYNTITMPDSSACYQSVDCCAGKSYPNYTKDWAGLTQAGYYYENANGSQSPVGFCYAAKTCPSPEVPSCTPVSPTASNTECVTCTPTNNYAGEVQCQAKTQKSNVCATGFKTGSSEYTACTTGYDYAGKTACDMGCYTCNVPACNYPYVKVTSNDAGSKEATEFFREIYVGDYPSVYATNPYWPGSGNPTTSNTGDYLFNRISNSSNSCTDGSVTRYETICTGTPKSKCNTSTHTFTSNGCTSGSSYTIGGRFSYKFTGGEEWGTCVKKSGGGGSTSTTATISTTGRLRYGCSTNGYSGMLTWWVYLLDTSGNMVNVANSVTTTANESQDSNSMTVLPGTYKVCIHLQRYQSSDGGSHLLLLQPSSLTWNGTSHAVVDTGLDDACTTSTYTLYGGQEWSIGANITNTCTGTGAHSWTSPF